ncbi:hypothetical protein DPMN_078588 [Dreissena polymorpha]|uniref:Uncharacterized protein n=1 Tax=Dreissena polymorpha TaxID=45954 RepID=A0A9D3YP35_DREPO|nr:hypothetical protein DPMN_078588 [Dreissena polymorpha]
MFTFQPLKVTVIPDWVIEEIDKNLQFRSEKEEALRSLFDKAREATVDTVQKLLDDLRQAKEKGRSECIMFVGRSECTIFVSVSGRNECTMFVSVSNLIGVSAPCLGKSECTMFV